jgi:7-cyano-7-deazaguanine synthase in queuosine biosynthesis
MIVASAIKTKGGSLFVGKRHSDCFANARKIYESFNVPEEVIKTILLNCSQGFLTDSTAYLTREEAYEHAVYIHQIKDKEINNCLTSEELW